MMIQWPWESERIVAFMNDLSFGLHVVPYRFTCGFGRHNPVDQLLARTASYRSSTMNSADEPTTVA